MGYGKYSTMWLEAGDRAGASAGMRAYAHKTAAMWENMRAQCQQEYDDARASGVPADQLDQTRVSRLLLCYPPLLTMTNSQSDHILQSA